MLKNAIYIKENIGSFIDFYKQEMNSSSLRDSTKRNHLSTLTILQEFKKEIYFPDLTFEFIASFESFLLARGHHINTIAKHMKHLKRYINTLVSH